MTSPTLHELASIAVESGVSFSTGAGFVIIRATAIDGTLIYGQCPPETMREIAHNYLEVAESDAAVFAELTDGLGLPEAAAASFIAALRNRRNNP